MDLLTFIAELVKAVAWPLTILVIFLILRRRLMEIIPFIERLRYGNLELDFTRRVEELALEVRRELPASTGKGQSADRQNEKMASLAQLSPRAVILESWLQLEEAAVEAARRHQMELTSQETRSPLLLGQALAEAGILDENKQKIFYRLRNLRNSATHASDFAFEPEAAIDYADSAARLAEYIRRA